MNTNVTLPTIEHVEVSTLILSWRDGAGETRTMHYDLGDAVGSAQGYLTEMVQHVYLCGVDNGITEARLAHEQGFSEGGQDTPITNISNADALEMFNRGVEQRRNANETGQRIENLMAQNRRQLEAAQQRADMLDNQVNILRHDGSVIAQRLLDEAVRRGWCPDYDAFVADVNNQLQSLQLITREKQYLVRLEVEWEVDTTSVTRAVGAYDCGIESTAEAWFYCDVTCAPADIEDEANSLKYAAERVHGVESVCVSWDEVD
jgi:hypothetical protein